MKVRIIKEQHPNGKERFAAFAEDVCGTGNTETIALAKLKEYLKEKRAVITTEYEVDVDME